MDIVQEEPAVSRPTTVHGFIYTKFRTRVLHIPIRTCANGYSSSRMNYAKLLIHNLNHDVAAVDTDVRYC